MIPAYARPAHRRLRQKLAEMAQWNETSHLTVRTPGDKSLGIITSGISYFHACEAAPQAISGHLLRASAKPVRLVADHEVPPR